MLNLHSLTNTTKERKLGKVLGRGIGSGKGKTCGRGEKGAGSRSGYKRRYGYEGGQFRFFMKVPIRGFSNVRFQHKLTTVNLGQIDQVYSDGEVVNAETLKKYGFYNNRINGIKLLGDGEITKKVSFEIHSISKSARDKLQKAKLSFKLLKEEKESLES
jgi:large subunit ribosomal protein L15